GRDNSRYADAQPTNDPRSNKNRDIGRECRSHRTNEIKNTDPEEGSLTSEMIGRPTTNQRSDDSAIKGRGHRDAMNSRAEAPKRLDCLFSTRDHDCVEAE